ncbi:MAG TPA: HEAT repeat domain-containing protein [Chitinispirillaceae bacterium]|nr:HEAT repeat domain-containing protein [Chitinispirillaceae bacterium]
MAESLVANSGPEGILRGALEKIVFFECRVSQLTAELAAERAAVLREKDALATVRAREVELEMLLAQARSSINTMNLRAVELEERVRLLEAEREQFLAGFVERAQVSSAPGEVNSENSGEQTDLAALAGFIAELREKIEQLKLWKSAAQKAGISIEEGNNTQPTESFPSVANIADRFEKTGRLSAVTNEADRMKDQFATRAECSLYESAMGDLGNGDPGRRKRAADCLRALGSHAASPLIISALSREKDAEVKVALLGALAAVGESSDAGHAIREIADPRPEVRVAALDATAALAKEHAEPALSGALSDSNSFVRRRAVLLLSFLTTTTATRALTSMISDLDPGVARIAVLALSGRPDIQAQSALTKALNHQETAVRRCAADAVMSWSGETVEPDASPVERRRAVRKIAGKLSRLDEGALRKAVSNAPPAAVKMGLSSTVHQKPMTETSIPVISKKQDAQKVENEVAEDVVRPVAQVTVVGKESSALESTLIGEIRASLRGRTAEELSGLINTELSTVTAMLTKLASRGIVSQHGPRFFMS